MNRTEWVVIPVSSVSERTWRDLTHELCVLKGALYVVHNFLNIMFRNILLDIITIQNTTISDVVTLQQRLKQSLSLMYVTLDEKACQML